MCLIYKNAINIAKITLLVSVATLVTSCKKFIEIDGPDTSVNQKNVYTSNSNAISALTGIYTKMANNPYSLNLSSFTDFSSDNLTLFDFTNQPIKMVYQNALSQRGDNATTTFWVETYSYIYDANAAIEGLTQSDKLTKEIKDHLLGEAYFLRGFFYFYLVNLYGDVPLVTSTDYKVNSTLPRIPVSDIYKQITNDIQLAQQLLTSPYVDGSITHQTAERTRPNQMTATALLSRVYLYNKRYKEAETEASKIITATDIYSLGDINKVFLKNSTETIWALQPVSGNANTKEGSFYIYSPEGPNSTNYAVLSKNLLNTFEQGDSRKLNWIAIFKDGNNTEYSSPYKYKVKDGNPTNALEYTIVFRLAEQYLIRAESRIEQGNIDAGIGDLNLIRARSRALATLDVPAPLPELKPGMSLQNAKSAVQHERRVELFTEWGNRWFDLKRTGNINGVMTSIAPSKGSIWQSNQALYPIPLVEILSNPNLTQNPGYN